MSPYRGRHRAEDITLDLTVDNLARYYAHQAVRARTRYTGHLGTRGRHEWPTVPTIKRGGIIYGEGALEFFESSTFPYTLDGAPRRWCPQHSTDRMHCAPRHTSVLSEDTQ